MFYPLDFHWNIIFYKFQWIHYCDLENISSSLWLGEKLTVYRNISKSRDNISSRATKLSRNLVLKLNFCKTKTPIQSSKKQITWLGL